MFPQAISPTRNRAATFSLPYLTLAPTACDPARRQPRVSAPGGVGGQRHRAARRRAGPAVVGSRRVPGLGRLAAHRAGGLGAHAERRRGAGRAGPWARGGSLLPGDRLLLAAAERRRA